MALPGKTRILLIQNSIFPELLEGTLWKQKTPKANVNMQAVKNSHFGSWA
jgi:hypothetical protein